jgi:Ca2+-dependent lipid-binding protein
MAEIQLPEKSSESNNPLDSWIGLMVVFIATFIGICNVKDDNIVQQMQLRQVERNDSWAWFQARNIRQAVYEGVAAELSVPQANETPEIKSFREAKSEEFRKKSESQEKKAEKQKADAEEAQQGYDKLNDMDDQFDLCDATLALSLALMGVTALTKKWWLFFIALIPATFGFIMGLAGFCGWDTNFAIIKSIIKILS